MATTKKKVSSSKKSSKSKLLDKIGNVDESTKNMVQNEETINIDSEEDKIKKKKKSKAKTKHNQVTDFSTYLNIKITEDDNILSTLVKEEINRRHITRDFVLSRIIDLYDMDEEQASNLTYNIIYTASKGFNISAKRLSIWLEILGLRNIGLDYDEPDSSLMSSLNYDEN